MAVELDFEREPMPIVMSASLSLVSRSHTLRCDARQAERRFIEFEEMISRVEHFYLGDWLPKPFVKGNQPNYIESIDSCGVPVVNTLAIQNLMINPADCRHISDDDFEKLEDSRKLKQYDVLLTMDGGVSIGKTVLFYLEGDFTVDSHVAILRPEGVAPKVLVYLLASPIGQLQFQQAESGASGQTSVTEEDVRRFRFPKIQLDSLESLVNQLDQVRVNMTAKRRELEQREKDAWESFNVSMLKQASRL